MKRIALTLAAGATALTIIPMFSAFEAHVINVTAKIENALSVPVKFLEYGTVFPQEHLEKDVPVRLSESFMQESRVDDVEYFIRQKPKCAITRNNGRDYDNTVGNNGEHLYTRTGHVVVVGENGGTRIECGGPPRQLAEGESWGPLPSLCPYLSKHERTEDGQETNNDGNLPAFHQPFMVDASGTIIWNDVYGRLSKVAPDPDDIWTIDLAVPCFGGYCAQDWQEFVRRHNPHEAPNADKWTQPIENEHKIFGCDLWFEVKGVSETRPQCSDGVDNVDPEDQLVDADDPGCRDESGNYDPSDNDETDPVVP